MIWYILIAIISYLIGSINFSIIISKKIAGYDIRQKGSGNAGSTNVLRNLGKLPALATVVLDILKGVVSVLLALIVGKIQTSLDPGLLVQIAGFFVVIGHCYPIFYNFKGGKGVATSLGILLIINFKIGLICLIFALSLMAITKMVSLGSVASAILFPILTLFINSGYIVKGGNYFIFSLLMALLIIYKHRENIKRIIDGKENKISFKK